MTAQTPILAIPYPQNTDRVADGNEAMQAMAERLEAILAGGWQPAGAGTFTFIAGQFTNNIGAEASRIRKLGNRVRWEVAGTWAGANSTGNFGNVSIGSVAAAYRPVLASTRWIPLWVSNSQGFSCHGGLRLDTGEVQMWGTQAGQQLNTGDNLRWVAEWFTDA